MGGSASGALISRSRRSEVLVLRHADNRAAGVLAPFARLEPRASVAAQHQVSSVHADGKRGRCVSQQRLPRPPAAVEAQQPERTDRRVRQLAIARERRMSDGRRQFPLAQQPAREIKLQLGSGGRIINPQAIPGCRDQRISGLATRGGRPPPSRRRGGCRQILPCQPDIAPVLG